MAHGKGISLKETVSRNLRIFRLEKGLTQKEVAERAGYHVTYYARLETDPQNISLDGLDRLSVALDKESWQFLSTKGSRVKNEVKDKLVEALKLLRIVEVSIG